MNQLPQGNDMVLVRYQGRNVGSTTWGGPGTVPSGRYYRFGANNKDRIKFVSKSDESWFYNFRENGQQIFFPEKPVQPAQQIITKLPKETLPEEIVPEDKASGEVSSEGELTVKVQRIIEEGTPLPTDTPIDALVGEPIEEPRKTLLLALPNPGTMTLKQIEALTLSPEDWRELGRREMKGKKRNNVLTYIKSQVKND